MADIDFSFCPELDDMIRSQRAVGKTGRVFDDLGSLSTVNNLAVLRNFMLQRRPARTLEVGLGFGGSALVMAATLRELGQGPPRRHTAIDPYQESVWDTAGLLAIERAGLADLVDFRSQPSAIALAAFAGSAEKFDLIYIDGSHLFEDVFVDAYFAFQLLADDGVLMFDDCTTNHVAKVLSFVRSNWSDWIEEIDLAPYRADGGSLHYKTGKLLSRVQLRAFRLSGRPPRSWDSPLRRF